MGASWGADNSDADVITLDSPVNGIWPASVATMAVCCNDWMRLIAKQLDTLILRQINRR